MSKRTAPLARRPSDDKLTAHQPRRKRKRVVKKLSAAEKKKRQAEAQERAKERAEREDRINRREFVIAMLPFVNYVEPGKKGTTTNYWSVKATGDFTCDRAIGQHFAVQFLHYARERGEDAELFVDLIEEMVKRGSSYCPHVRRGFLDALATLIRPRGL